MDLITELLPYQTAGVEKLKSLKIGALLMDMGTGKTRTALELIKIRLDEHEVDQVLWLCPCSVKENLKADLKKHCGSYPEEVKICGIESISSSNRIYLEILDYVKNAKTYLIVDESALIKNPFAKRSKRIQDYASQCTYKLILNGTPVTRNEADLFEQFMILDWRILGYRSYYSFAANHLVFKEVKDPSGRKVQTNQVVNVLDKDYLAERIEPYTYQVKKSEVLELPIKEYVNVPFHMTDRQHCEYIETRDLFLEDVDELDSTTIYRLFTALQHVTSGRRITSGLESPMETEDIFDNWQNNPRVGALSECIDDYIGDGEQVIIFAKFEREIEEIEQLLDDRDMTYALYTGTVPAKKREQEMKKFRDGDAQFLLTMKSAGAYGLNLQFCRNIIFYNNDFDFGTRLQAEDRIYRFGQDHAVWIYDIADFDTIDGMISGNLADKKSMLDNMKEMIKKWQKEKKEGEHDAEVIQESERV